MVSHSLFTRRGHSQAQMLAQGLKRRACHKLESRDQAPRAENQHPVERHKQNLSTVVKSTLGPLH